MGNVLDIQFTFGDVNAVASPSCSHGTEQPAVTAAELSPKAQPLSGPVAARPQDLG